jgi:hypothetical protein
MSDDRQSPGISRFQLSPGRVVFLTFLGIGGYFLLAEHWAHVVGYLPLALLMLVCGGMHFFMHGSHDHGHDGHSRPDENAPKPPQQGDKTP